MFLTLCHEVILGHLISRYYGPNDYVILLTKQCVFVWFALEDARTSIFRDHLFILPQTQELMQVLDLHMGRDCLLF